ncbi:VOC family protein [Consotaella aegiceratis]|uniref:VOC family protein n=1 Tax=Consotaella aegiceratis TaxID=3097961 RepID=UPI002F40BFC5
MAHKSRLGCLVVDCQTTELEGALAFWSGLFGCSGEIDEDGRYAVLKMPDGEPRVLIQAVDHSPRVHLDIETDDKEAEAKRLEALGAKRIAAIKTWIVMEAPTGHRFCVVGPSRPDFSENARSVDG